MQRSRGKKNGQDSDARLPVLFPEGPRPVRTCGDVETAFEIDNETCSRPSCFEADHPVTNAAIQKRFTTILSNQEAIACQGEPCFPWNAP